MDEQTRQYVKDYKIKNLISTLAETLATSQPSDPILHLIRRLHCNPTIPILLNVYPSENRDLSRVEWALGKKTIEHTCYSLKIGVFGLRGLGVEAARNLLLIGPDRLLIHDDEKVTEKDIGPLWYSKDAVGSKRSSVLEPMLRTLNPNTQIQIHSGPISNKDLDGLSVVIFTGLSSQWKQKRLVDIDKYCSEKGIVFIWGGAFGLSLSVFTNFGPKIPPLSPSPMDRPLVIERVTPVVGIHQSLVQFLSQFLPAYILPEKMTKSERIQWGRKILKERLGERVYQDIEGKMELNEEEAILDVAEQHLETRSERRYLKVICNSSFHENHALRNGDFVTFTSYLPSDTKLVQYPISPAYVPSSSSAASPPPQSLRSSVKATERFHLDEAKRLRHTDDIKGKAFEVLLDRKRANVFYVVNLVGNEAAGGAALVQKLQDEKPPRNHKSFEQCLSTVQDVKTHGIQHATLLALLIFQETHGHLPHIANESHAEEIVKFAEKIRLELKLGENRKSSVKSFAKRFSRTAEREATPLCIMGGGIIAQEALKTVSVASVANDFQTPKLLSQWARVNAYGDVSDEDGLELREGDSILFGSDFSENVARVRVLAAGLGAVGSEFIRAASAIGLGSGGGLEIVDGEVVKMCDIPLGAGLFSNKDEGEYRAVAAANRLWSRGVTGVLGHSVWPSIQAENELTSELWSDLNFVVADTNALSIGSEDDIGNGNDSCYSYIANQCETYGVPLLRLQTENLEGHCHIFVPRHTQPPSSFSTKSDPLETNKATAKMVLTTKDCILHAKELFNALFGLNVAAQTKKSPKRESTFVNTGYSLAHLSQWSREALGSIRAESLSMSGDGETPPIVSHKACVHMAMKTFVGIFSDGARHLNHLHCLTGLKGYQLLCAPGALKWDALLPGRAVFVWKTACFFKKMLSAVGYGNGNDENNSEGGLSLEEVTTIARSWYGSSQINIRDECKEIPITAIPLDVDGKEVKDWIHACATLLTVQRSLPYPTRIECHRIASNRCAASPATTSILAGFASLQLCKALSRRSGSGNSLMIRKKAPREDTKDDALTSTNFDDVRFDLPSTPPQYSSKTGSMSYSDDDSFSSWMMSLTVSSSNDNSHERSITKYAEPTAAQVVHDLKCSGVHPHHHNNPKNQIVIPRSFVKQWDFVDLHSDLPLKAFVANFGKLLGIEHPEFVRLDLITAVPATGTTGSDEGKVIFRRKGKGASSDNKAPVAKTEDEDDTTMMSELYYECCKEILPTSFLEESRLLVFGLKASVVLENVPKWTQQYMPGNNELLLPRLRLFLNSDSD
eukprot:jgi/Bigna1/86575/estExt_fgenesh1_pg.C_110254